MKKTLFSSALFAIVFATAVVTTSCQKEKENEKDVEKTMAHFNPANLQIDDMNAYLVGFKEKMKNASTKGSTETMGIEEAAWHLSSVANHDFANIGASHDTLRFDTLYCHVNVIDGMISMADINAAYEEISHEIVHFKKNLGCENPNFWFIDTKISANGDVIIPLTTMFTANCSKLWGSNYWFFANSTDADSICSTYLDSLTTYYADDNAKTTLSYILTLKASYQLPENAYFTNYGNQTFEYQNHIDPNGSPFYANSRLYASIGKYHHPVSFSDMCYAFDSYAGLAWDYAIFTDKFPICFEVHFWPTDYGYKKPVVGRHKLNLTCANVVNRQPEPGGGGSNY